MQQIFWWLHCCILLTNRILNRLAPLFCFSSVALQTISISFDWMWSTGLDISYPFRMWQFAKLIVSFGLMIGQRFVRNLNKQWMETRVITKRMMKWRAVLLIRRQMDGVVWNVLWLVELRKFEFLYIDWFWNRCRVTSPSVAMQLEFKVFFFHLWQCQKLYDHQFYGASWTVRLIVCLAFWKKRKETLTQSHSNILVLNFVSIQLKPSENGTSQQCD